MILGQHFPEHSSVQEDQALLCQLSAFRPCKDKDNPGSRCIGTYTETKIQFDIHVYRQMERKICTCINAHGDTLFHGAFTCVERFNYSLVVVMLVLCTAHAVCYMIETKQWSRSRAPSIPSRHFSNMRFSRKDDTPMFILACTDADDMMPCSA